MSTAQRLRQQFIDYFQQHGHTLVPPSPIIPQDDPTLLFVNAGMNQFKDVLLGREKRRYTRAISVQPCMRVGGKHNDLDEVGRDGRHLTWFEMLGNWSFGDYGKEEAIAWAWELTTQMGLDLNRVTATVYKTDDEAYALWQKISSLPDERIVRLGDIEQGDEENFWSMGPTGPCGRCTELYYDQGEEHFGHDVVGGETDRFLEFWNVVFMEFNRDESGAFTPLPMLSVDTGMGMERITALLEGKTNLFETSLFQPLIDAAAALSGKAPEGDNLVSMRVLADHSRALTFTLADGGSFDRQGRGYVLRRILRRAVLHGHKLGFTEPFLYKLVTTNLALQPAYTAAAAQQAALEQAIKAEEERFFATLERGIGFFARAAEGGSISGDAAFQLHDTFGFPIDLTRLMSEEKNIPVDSAGFEAALEQQRQRSSASATFYDQGGWTVLSDDTPETTDPYDHYHLPVRVLQFRPADDGAELILSVTPFYSEGGGELADYGTLENNDIALRVTNVRKGEAGIIHSAVLERGRLDSLGKETELTATVDRVRRRAKAAHHTATHLLHAALHKLLGSEVRQMGSMVDAHRLRFDIALERPLTTEEMTALNRMVNGWIHAAHPVEHHAKVPMAQAQAMGALAFFGDKYGDEVRVIAIPGVSTELCGGNHVRNTAEIGSFLLLGDEALGAGVRRLEAVCQQAASDHALTQHQQLAALTRSLGVKPDGLETRIDKLQSDLKAAKAAYQKALKSGGGGLSVDALLKTQQTIGSWEAIIADCGDAPDTLMAETLDKLKAALPSLVIVLCRLDSETGKALALTGAGDDAVQHGAHAGRLAKTLGQAMGGGGGGKPGFAKTGFAVTDMAAVLTAAREAVAAL